MSLIYSFDVGTWNSTSYSVDFVSNSTVSGFYFIHFKGALVRFNVTSWEEATGFFRVTIPKGLLWGEDGWAVLVDYEPIMNLTIISVKTMRTCLSLISTA